MSATLRVHQVLRASGLQTEEDGFSPPVRITHALNEVWAWGCYVIRINPHPGHQRLRREAAILRRLPTEVRAPVVVAVGSASWGEWQVTRRLPGQDLSRVWGALDESQRRQAVTELAGVMKALHQIEGVSGAPPYGRVPHPLPTEVLLGVLAGLMGRPGIDRGVIYAASERVGELADAVDEHSTTLVHGDIHLENVLAYGGTITGLIDFEWARCGPPDLDLDVLLHSLSNPDLHVHGGAGAPLKRGDFDAVVGWLRAAYPELFAHPRLADRLWVYRLAYDARALETAGPDVGAQHHPYQRIVRLLQGRSDLMWFVGT